MPIENADYYIYLAPLPVVDAESFAPQVKEVIAVLRAPDVSGEAKNMALRSIVDKIVFNKHAGTFDIYFKSV